MVADATVQAESAFVADLTRHRKVLLKVARVFCGNPADRDDLIQDITIHLWRGYASFDGRSQFSTWMYRVALNVAISWTRSEITHRRRVKPTEQNEIDSIPAHEASEQRFLDQNFIETMLAALPELDRALMLLHLEGHDHATISDILGISTSNVATKLNRIKERLQQQFT